MRRLLLLLLLSSAVGADAQIGFSAFNGRSHPEIDWQVAETENFEIVYPAHLAGIEAEAASIAEASLAVLVRNMGPDSAAVSFDDPIRLYLSDEDEIANGIAFNLGPSGFTTIWVHVNDAASIWTGDVKWLRKVIAHELAHLVHYRATRSSLGTLGIFFGDPFPSFWTEGLAQYQTEAWDAQRGDRWLRTATFEDRLNYNDGTSPQNGRLRYAVGNSQVRYLAQTYGDSTLSAILAHRRPALFGLARVHDFYDAFQAVTGQSYRAFNEEWRQHVNVYYNTQAGQMERLDSLDAKPFSLPGQVVYDVAFSPDTSRVAAVVLPSLARPVRRLITVSNPGADSTAPRDLRILAEGSIAGPVSWSPDGTQIAYARTRRGEYGSLVNDLYTVTTDGDITRLTTDRRASSPSFAPDGRRIAFVGLEGGTANVFVLDLEGGRAVTGSERALTSFEGDTQIPTVRWGPTGDRVAFDLFDLEGRRDLATVEVETGQVTRLGTSPRVRPQDRDDRLPVWNAAGDSLAFTSLRDRAPNAFLVDADLEVETP
ncbi:peptidase MA family metallohydrolase, partial [Rubrivirga sp.]|uniref:peptidase MA family metallohydrolase n=1 Tax=Rubrivirga sp. TaxID=1885344 RepID=UPI003C73F2C0